MKKLIIIFLVFLGILTMAACSNVRKSKLIIIDSSNFIYDKPKENKSYFSSGTEIVLHSYPIMDVDLAMYIEGEYYSK